jgi:hypothetical protein
VLAILIGILFQENAALIQQDNAPARPTGIQRPLLAAQVQPANVLAILTGMLLLLNAAISPLIPVVPALKLGIKQLQPAARAQLMLAEHAQPHGTQLSLLAARQLPPPAHPARLSIILALLLAVIHHPLPQPAQHAHPTGMLTLALAASLSARLAQPAQEHGIKIKLPAAIKLILLVLLVQQDPHGTKTPYSAAVQQILNVPLVLVNGIRFKTPAVVSPI